MRKENVLQTIIYVYPFKCKRAAAPATEGRASIACVFINSRYACLKPAFYVKKKIIIDTLSSDNDG